MLTATFRQTNVFGAGISVITLKATNAEALTLIASVISSAGVEVVTGSLVELVHAARFSITTVVGAKIAIFTVEHPLAHACPVAAEIADRACIAIIAGLLVGNLDATGGRVTAIGCTDVFIITAEGPGAQAQAAGTLVRYGAGIPVVTERVIGGGNTSVSGITAIVGADVPIIALQYSQP